MRSDSPEVIVDDYIDSIISGKRIAGNLEKLAVERYLHDLDHAADRGYRFDVDLAKHACNFFSCLHHSKGEWAGKEFILAGWEAFIVWNIFGWVRITDRFRRFRTAYIETARKNGKSTIGAGIGWYCFVADAEPGAEVYTASTKRDQSRIVHAEAVRMRKASPTLIELVESYKDNLSIPETASKYEPLGADVDGMDGLNVHAAIVDEVHAHKSRKCWDLLETGIAARRQPLMFAITTAGVDKGEESICWELHSQGTSVLEGFKNGSYIDDRFFAFIAAMDKGDDWRNPSSWEKANPNLRISVKEDIISDQCKDAINNPGKENAFRRLRCNEWTEQYTRWISIREGWDACPNDKVSDEALRRLRAFGGLDLANSDDLAAFVLAFPGKDNIILKGRYWIPENNIKKVSKNGKIPIKRWIEEGYMEVTNGNICDYKVIRQRILEDSRQYRIKELAYDPWNATQLVTDLMDDGANMIEVSQSFKALSPPSKEWESAVKGKILNHQGDPVLRWMMGNVSIEEDSNGNIKPSRKSSKQKIDGVIAGIMALSRLIVHRDNRAYRRHGVRSFDITDKDIAEYRAKKSEDKTRKEDQI